MTTYAVIEKATGLTIYQYDSGTGPIEWAGMEFAEFDHQPLPSEPVPKSEPAIFAGRRELTRLEFISLLGDDAFVAILGAARTNVEIEAFVKLIEYATPDPQTGYSVSLDDPRMNKLFILEQLLVAQGVVQDGWAQGVLNG